MKKIVAALFALYLLQNVQPAYAQARKIGNIRLTNQQCYQTIDNIVVIAFKGRDFKLTSDKNSITIEYGVPGGQCISIYLENDNSALLSATKYTIEFKDKPVLIVSGNIGEPEYVKPHKVMVPKKR